MDTTELTPRTVGLVALLALLPVVVFAVTLNETFAGVVTVVNVLIIAYSLRLLTTPVEGAGHGENGHESVGGESEAH